MPLKPSPDAQQTLTNPTLGQPTSALSHGVCAAKEGGGHAGGRSARLQRRQRRGLVPLLGHKGQWLEWESLVFSTSLVSTSLPCPWYGKYGGETGGPIWPENGWERGKRTSTRRQIGWYAPKTEDFWVLSQLKKMRKPPKNLCNGEMKDGHQWDLDLIAKKP